VNVATGPKLPLVALLRAKITLCFGYNNVGPFMTQTPLVLYLDTQDYINLFNEPDDGPNHAILEQLMDHKNRGEIVIGYSWVIMLEFITRPTEKFREERV